jgi:hypothetical protein
VELRHTVIFYGKHSDLTGLTQTRRSVHARPAPAAVALVHINFLLLQAVLEVPEFHDSIGGAERRALTPVVLKSQQTRTTGSTWTWTPCGCQKIDHGC